MCAVKKKALLLEPNYANKYPPIALMKISTYLKNRGDWDVTFYKGDLKDLVIETLADKCIQDLSYIDSSIEWVIRKDKVIDYIRTRTREALDEVGVGESDMCLLLTAKLEEYKNIYRKDEWSKYTKWDRVFVTTLFTFYWDITVQTINFAKKFVKKPKDLMVGGVLASIQPRELEDATGIKPHIGLLNTPGELDKGDSQIIDELPLDYSILDEIEYKYPMENAYYGYTTRGCIRHCPFCAVPTLEPTYNAYIPLKSNVERVRELYGEQKDLLLMDNNVLASPQFEDIINDIIASGFAKGEKYTEPDQLGIAIRNLKNGFNDRAYIRKSQALIMSFYKTLKGEDSFFVYKVIDKYHIDKSITSTKKNILAAYEEIKPIYKENFHPSRKQRYVDFNQGVDARLFTPKIVKKLSSIAIRPLRVAFDNLAIRPQYEAAIRMSVKSGIKDFSNYLLYNFQDKPIELYQRLKINVDLCDELGVSIYSFPMKYHPLRKGEKDAIDFSHNRDYVGKHWNRKYIRAVQAILNSTKGKVGRGTSFFYEAFGRNEEEFFELLEMPETFILYRFFFKWLDKKGYEGTNHWRKCWKKCMKELPQKEKEKLLDTIHKNVFTEECISQFRYPLSKELLGYYTNYRKDIVTEGNYLYMLKQEYDKKPIKELRRKKHDH